MLVHPSEMRGPMAAFNGRIIVQPDMIIADERAIPAAPTSSTHSAHVAYTRGSTALPSGTSPIRMRCTAAPEAETVQFQPPVVPGYDGLLNRMVTIVGVNDGHRTRNGENALRSAP